MKPRSYVQGILLSLFMPLGIGSAAEVLAVQPLPPVETRECEQAACFDANLEEEQSEVKPTVEERLMALEKNYAALGENYEELQGKLKTTSVSGHGEATMKISGRIHLDYWAFPESSPAINVFENNDPDISPQDRLGFRRLRFGVGGNIWQNMLYRIEIEFAGGNDVEYRDAYLGWKDLPILQELLVGNQKRPYGLDHINSSRYNVFLERPIVIEAINQDARRLGVQSWAFSEDLAWNWRYGAFNQRLTQDEGNYVSDHFQGEVAGRLANTFWYDEASGGRGYGHWAVSGTVADPDGSDIDGRATNEARFRTRDEARSVNRWIDTGVIDGADHYEMVGLENVWNFGPVQVVGEYQNLWLDRNGGTDLHFDGGYFYVAYFLTGENMTWDRETGQLDRIYPWENFFLVDTCNDGVRGGWGAWQIAYRMSYANFTDEDILGGRGLSQSVALNWYWNAYGRLQIDATYGEIDNHEGFDEDGDPLGPLSGHFVSIGTRFSVDF